MEPKLVLVVDDNPDDRAIYGDLLWYNGFDVIFAETAEQGYWFTREGSPDLVVLDLGLPDADGLELCRRIKGEGATKEIPVLVLSARPVLEFGAEANRSGCASYMEKPTQPLEVLREVERLIGAAPGGGAPVPGRVAKSWSVEMGPGAVIPAAQPPPAPLRAVRSVRKEDASAVPQRSGPVIASDEAAAGLEARPVVAPDAAGASERRPRGGAEAGATDPPAAQ